jgi:hypothetical protein
MCRPLHDPGFATPTMRSIADPKHENIIALMDILEQKRNI